MREWPTFASDKIYGYAPKSRQITAEVELAKKSSRIHTLRPTFKREKWKLFHPSNSRSYQPRRKQVTTTTDLRTINSAGAYQHLLSTPVPVPAGIWWRKRMQTPPSSALLRTTAPLIRVPLSRTCTSRTRDVKFNLDVNLGGDDGTGRMPGSFHRAQLVDLGIIFLEAYRWRRKMPLVLNLNIAFIHSLGCGRFIAFFGYEEESFSESISSSRTTVREFQWRRFSGKMPLCGGITHACMQALLLLNSCCFCSFRCWDFFRW